MSKRSPSDSIHATWRCRVQRDASTCKAWCTLCLKANDHLGAGMLATTYPSMVRRSGGSVRPNLHAQVLSNTKRIHRFGMPLPLASTPSNGASRLHEWQLEGRAVARPYCHSIKGTKALAWSPSPLPCLRPGLAARSRGPGPSPPSSRPRRADVLRGRQPACACDSPVGQWSRCTSRLLAALSRALE